MFKSLYSQTFVGTAGSTVPDEAKSPYALAVLPSYPVFDDSAIDTEKNGINLPMSEELSQTFQVKVDSTGDRFHFTSHKSYTESGIVEGSPVSFNFDAVLSSEAKVIQADVVYFVHRVDVASSPPLFSVSHSRGASAPIAFKKISYKGPKSAAADTNKAEATFLLIDEGTPVSFGFDINTAGEVIKAGKKLYAKDVDIKVSPRAVFFRVSLKPGPQHKPITITNFEETANRRVQLRVRHKSIRVLLREQKPGQVIARAADLRSAPVLDVSPRSFDSLTPEMMQVICVHDIDRCLLHALSNFASACKFFDFSSRSTCSEFQNRTLQEARRHMEQFGMTSQRDIGALEVLEYAAHRLLSLSAHLNSQAESKRKEDDKKLKKDKQPPLTNLSKRAQAAWDVISLYGATLLCDSDGAPRSFDAAGALSADLFHSIHSIQQNSTAFCVQNGGFVLVRNGFIVIGETKSGKCTSLQLDELTKSVSDAPSLFNSDFRPCVVDAKFVGSSLYLMILTSPPASHELAYGIFARILKVDKVSFGLKDGEMEPLLPMRKELIPPDKYLVGEWPFGSMLNSRTAFCVSIPKFVSKPPRWTKHLHVFAVSPAQSTPFVFSVSLSDYTVHECALQGPTPTGYCEYLSSVILQRPKQDFQDFWLLCRAMVSSSLKLKLCHFGLEKSNIVFVGEEELDIPAEFRPTILKKHLPAPVDLWQMYLTNYGLGVGVALPDGHFYQVVKSDDESKEFGISKVESPFFADGHALPHTKYVPWQFNVPLAAEKADSHRKETKETAAKLGSTIADRDEFILKTFSLTPHFLAVHLPYDWKKRGLVDDPLRITIPFCPTRNITQRLLRAMEGPLEIEPPMVASEELQSQQSRLVEAMKQYADLLKEKLLSEKLKPAEV